MKRKKKRKENKNHVYTFPICFVVLKTMALNYTNFTETAIFKCIVHLKFRTNDALEQECTKFVTFFFVFFCHLSWGLYRLNSKHASTISVAVQMAGQQFRTLSKFRLFRNKQKLCTKCCDYYNSR